MMRMELEISHLTLINETNNKTNYLTLVVINKYFDFTNFFYELLFVMKIEL